MAFVSNNGFLDGIAFDGMRKHLARDFAAIYHVDLKGNARTSGARRRREAGNIFDDAIRVGVGITFLVRKVGAPRPGRLYLHRVGDYLEARDKRAVLDQAVSLANLTWQELHPDERGTWLTAGLRDDWDALLPLGSKDAKAGGAPATVFTTYSNGVKTNRDTWTYNFRRDDLAANMRRTIEFYNAEVSRYQRPGPHADLDTFVTYDDAQISWSASLKAGVQRGRFAGSSRPVSGVRCTRPYATQYLYFDRTFANERVYQMQVSLPTQQVEDENRLLCVSGLGTTKSFSCIETDCIPEVQVTGNTQCFPFYTYNEDGSNRRENVTMGAGPFRTQYGDRPSPSGTSSTTSTPCFTTQSTGKVRRQPPARPAPHPFCTLEFRGLPPPVSAWPCTSATSRSPSTPCHVETPDANPKGVVDKMAPVRGPTQIEYNDYLTLAGIPPVCLEYRLGNRSALEWVIDQYRVPPTTAGAWSTTPTVPTIHSTSSAPRPGGRRQPGNRPPRRRPPPAGLSWRARSSPPR